MRTDPRPFITIAYGMATHPKVEGLSDKAFRLLVECWLWCAEHGTDGVISDARWRRLATPKARRELIENRLVSVANDCFVMHDFVEHQQSKSDRNRLSSNRSAAAMLGNHKRWHEARNEIDDGCDHCDAAYRKRIALAIARGSQTDRKPIAEVEVEREGRDFPTGAPVGDAHAQVMHNPPRGASGPNSTAAFRLVDDTLRGQQLTSITRTALAIEVTRLWPEATPDEISAALLRWNSRTNIGPALLPGLLDDIRKEARGATSRATPIGPKLAPSDAFVADFLATPTTPGLRALPGGA